MNIWDFKPDYNKVFVNYINYVYYNLPFQEQNKLKKVQAFIHKKMNHLQKKSFFKFNNKKHFNELFDSEYKNEFNTILDGKPRCFLPDQKSLFNIAKNFVGEEEAGNFIPIIEMAFNMRANNQDYPNEEQLLSALAISDTHLINKFKNIINQKLAG